MGACFESAGHAVERTGRALVTGCGSHRFCRNDPCRPLWRVVRARSSEARLARAPWSRAARRTRRRNVPGVPPATPGSGTLPGAGYSKGRPTQDRDAAPPVPRPALDHMQARRRLTPTMTLNNSDPRPFSKPNIAVIPGGPGADEGKMWELARLHRQRRKPCPLQRSSSAVPGSTPIWGC